MEKTFFNILHVEDNPADALLMKELFKGVKTAHKISVVKHGGEALDFLKRRGEFGASVMPDIIILDLNLPVMDGREFLAEIKSDEHFKQIPVIVLTTSVAQEDIRACYKNYASCYLNKPIELDEYRKIVEQIESFWFTTVSLPEPESLG
ncbi:MAG: response regulator [Nitrospinota bacterium]